MFDWFHKTERLRELRAKLLDLDLDIKALSRRVDDIALDVKMAKQKKIFKDTPQEKEKPYDQYKGVLEYE